MGCSSSQLRNQIQINIFQILKQGTGIALKLQKKLGISQIQKRIRKFVVTLLFIIASFELNLEFNNTTLVNIACLYVLNHLISRMCSISFIGGKFAESEAIRFLNFFLIHGIEEA